MKIHIEPIVWELEPIASHEVIDIDPKSSQTLLEKGISTE